ncbi:MAG: F0F1 ATP synthase subunit A, partial [Dehalococcoidia bacterium]|nr:F0F1 ATP synthase subunit A [Dehalococcoidia bacterium]
MGKVILLVVFALLVAGFFFRAPLPILSVAAEPVAKVGGFAITNTLIATWLTMVVVLLLFRKATSNMQLVPRGIQNVMETVVEVLLGLANSVAGVRYARVFFPLVGTIFFFVLFNSWLSLVPGFGTIGIIEKGHGHDLTFSNVAGVGVLMPQAGLAPIVPEAHPADDGHGAPPKADHAPGGSTISGTLIPILRGANTDINTTLALALTAIFFVEFWGFKFQGLAGYGGKFVNLSGFKQGAFMGCIYIIIGIIEFVSELARIMSFTFRLFGNMFAGEVLLAVITFLVPFVLADMFYMLEIGVGVVQAVVFGALTLVFAASAVAGHGD